MLKGVLRNFIKFTGQHLCQSLFFNKVADMRPATLFKKRLWHWCFSVNFVKFLRTPFVQNNLWTTAPRFKRKQFVAFNLFMTEAIII